MIKIEEVNPSGLFSFGEVDTVSIPDLGFCRVEGRNLDDGGSNGAGKTSFLNAIPQLLFAESESNASATKVVNDVWNKGCNAHVIFTDSKGDRYKVVLKRGWKGTKTDDPDGLTLYYWNNDQWEDRRGESIHETKKTIRSIVGFSYQQFISMSYMAQRAGLRFVDEPSIRPKIFTEMLDLGIYDKAAEEARKRARELQQELSNKENTREVLQKAIEDGAADAEAQLKELDIQVTKLTHDVSSFEQALHIKGEECEALERKFSEHDTVLAEGEGKIREIVHKWENDVRDTKKTDPPGISEIHVHMGVHESNIRRLSAELDGVLSDAVRCPKCGSEVTEEHLESHRKSLMDAQLAEEAMLSTLHQEKHKHQNEHGRWIDATVVQLTIEKDRALEPLYIEKTLISETIIQIEKELQPKKEEERELELQLTDLNGKLSQVEGQRTTWKSIAESLKQKKKDIQNLTKEIDDLSIRIITFKWIEKGFKRLKLHLFEEALVMMNDLVNKYLDLLYDGKISVTFDTRRLKAGAKAVSDDDYISSLSIFVQHGRKTSVALEEYSGAEKQIIALALVASFWELVSETTQSGTNILMLDEIFGSLDRIREDGVIKFLDYLKGMGKTVLVTDNTGVCDDAVEFEQILVVEKNDDISCVYLEAA